jgi:hypothetical protein
MNQQTRTIDQLTRFESPAKALEAGLVLESPIVLSCYHNGDRDRPKMFAAELMGKCPRAAVGYVASEPVYSGNMGVFHDFYAVLFCRPKTSSK